MSKAMLLCNCISQAARCEHQVVIKALDSVALNHTAGVVALDSSKGILTQNARLT